MPRRRRRSPAEPTEEEESHNAEQSQQEDDNDVVNLVESDSDIEIINSTNPVSQEERDHRIAMDLQRQLDREFMGGIVEERSDQSDSDMDAFGPSFLGLVRNIVERRVQMHLMEDDADDADDDDEDAAMRFVNGSDGDGEEGHDEKESDEKENKDDGDNAESTENRYNFRRRTLQQRLDRAAQAQLPIDSQRRRRGRPALPVRRLSRRSVGSDGRRRRLPTPPPPRHRARGTGIRGGGGLFGPGFRLMFGDNVFGIDDANNIFVRSIERGADATEIHALPTSKYKPPRQSSASDEKKKCLICLEELKSGDLVKTLPCFHVFHSKEIDTWLRQNVMCPICRQPIRQRT